MALRTLLTSKHVKPADEHVNETFESLTHLVKGAQRQRASILGRKRLRELFEELSTGQNPSAYVICCSDSRVSPPAVFHLPPGELFVHENIGNIVSPNDASIMAGVAYAVEVLKVKHILVLGHTGCGAMFGALDPSKLANEHVKAWIKNVNDLVKRVDAHYPDAKSTDERGMAAAQENVLMQMETLHEHPLVKEKVSREELAVFGFIYEINNLGTISGWDPKRRYFVPVNGKTSKLPRRKQ